MSKSKQNLPKYDRSRPRKRKGKKNRPFLQTETIAIEDSRMGLVLLTQFLTGKHKYTYGYGTQTLIPDPEYTWVTLPEKYPLPVEPGMMVTVVGDLGTSGSIGDFVYHVLGGNIDRIARFIIMKCEDMPGKHSYIVGVETVIGSLVEGEENPLSEIYLVGGMTDYSGEGGKAHEDLFRVIGYVYLSMGCSVVNVDITPVDWENLNLLVNKQKEIDQLEQESEDYN